MCQGPEPADGKLGATANGNGAAKQRSRSSQRDPTIIAGKEVVGRKVAVWNEKTMEWPEAVIAQFDPATAKHLVRFVERAPGSVKHEEQWINMTKHRFQWLSDQPANAASNPTYATAPKAEEAVGYRVRVFWPGMARWYQGKIEGYNPDTKRHTVKYRDGDVQRLQLRHEAVVYLDKVGVSSRSRSSSGRDRDREKSGKKAVSGAKRGRSGAGKHGKDEALAPNTVTPPKKRKGTNGRAGSTSASSDVLDSRGSSDEEEDSDCSSRDEDSEGFESSDASGEESDYEAGKGAKGRRRGAGSGPRSNGTARKRPKKSAAGPRKGSSSKATAAPEPPPKRRGRPPGSGTGRRGISRGRDGAARVMRGYVRVSKADEEIIRGAGSVIVGARVAVFWNEDQAYYKVRKSINPSSITWCICHPSSAPPFIPLFMYDQR